MNRPELIALLAPVTVQNILRVLLQEKRLPVEVIAYRTGRTHSNTSHHLALLKRNGIVECTKDGRFIYYRVNRKQRERVTSILYG